jgi:hypothetical protein
MVKWTIESSLDREYIYEKAAMLGWFDDPPRVQVREYIGMEGRWYLIEPYEEECNCPSLIRPTKALASRLGKGEQ